MTNTTRSIGTDKAIALYESGFWKDMSARQIAEFQMSVDELCVPFDVLHGAMEEALGRPVWTHEFGTEGAKQLRAELYDGAPPATFDQIVGLIPEDKRIIVIMEGGKDGRL